MRFNTHSELEGTHALLGASDYHWVNYDEEKLDRVFFNRLESVRGSDLHALAHDLIRLGVRLPDVQKTLNMYVNDGIGFRMESEVLLKYSINCYGTADCIIFRGNTLRIHDLKNGINPASMKQLEIYAALFCLEYGMNPLNINIELRIYQNNEIQIYQPTADTIFHIMDRIKTSSARIDYLREEVNS